MADDKTLLESSENKIKELHSNIRHITQLAMNWFAFFVTVNYVTMGWLAKGPGDGGANPHVVSIVARVFIVQNVLGAFGLAAVLVSAFFMKRQINRLENLATREANAADKDAPQKTETKDGSTPTVLYNIIGAFLIVVLISLIYAWSNIPSYYSK